MSLLKLTELPKSIQAIFPGCDKYPDFKAYVRVIKGVERYYVHFKGETTRFIYEDGMWKADKTW